MVRGPEDLFVMRLLIVYLGLGLVVASKFFPVEAQTANNNHYVKLTISDV